MSSSSSSSLDPGRGVRWQGRGDAGTAREQDLTFGQLQLWGIDVDRADNVPALEDHRPRRALKPGEAVVARPQSERGAEELERRLRPAVLGLDAVRAPVLWHRQPGLALGEAE